MTLKIKRLAHARDIALPRYETEGAAGMDIRAAVDQNAPLVLEAGAYNLVPTGLSLQIPQGFEGQIRPRSGLAAKNGVTILNAPGTIDSDYRGELKILLMNVGREPFTITRGLRIAQLVIAPVTHMHVEEVEELDDSLRGTGGFGSTGI
jgi:dUTP pyrophosphatase